MLWILTTFNITTFSQTNIRFYFYSWLLTDLPAFTPTPPSLSLSSAEQPERPC